MSSRQNDSASILVIDDEAEIIAGLEKLLKTAGYKCRGCRDEQAAIAALQEISPDLIISDINLAGHSGLALCERLKKQQGLTDVPLMFLSGAQIPDIIRRSHEAGGTYYLRKPYDPGVLLELIDKALWMPALVSAQGGR